MSTKTHLKKAWRDGLTAAKSRRYLVSCMKVSGVSGEAAEW